MIKTLITFSSFRIRFKKINTSKYDKTDEILPFLYMKGANKNNVKMKLRKLLMFVLITCSYRSNHAVPFLHLINFHHPSSNQNIMSKHLMMNLSIKDFNSSHF